MMREYEITEFTAFQEAATNVRNTGYCSLLIFNTNRLLQHD